MKKSLRQKYPYLVEGIMLILVGVAIIVIAFTYRGGNYLGGIVVGFFSAAFILIGLWGCLKKEKKKEVIFRSKSSWQKDDCINRSADYNCPNPSALEAVCGDSIVRCCEDEKCKKRAAELAKLY